MSNLTFYTDKKNNFKYKLNVQGDGANLANTSSRLCLEFKGGLNIYVKSKINETTGQCLAEIPSLDFIGESSGKLRIETIANKTYFPLYETDFKLKQSVKVNVEINENNTDDNIEETNEVTFGIQIDESNFEKEKVIEEKIKESPLENIKEKKKEETSNNELKSFEEWKNKS